MRLIHRKGMLAGMLTGLSCCVLTSANAWTNGDHAGSDTADSPATPLDVKWENGGMGDEGGIAGTSSVVFDNGPVATGGTPPAGCAAGNPSFLQNDTMCLNILGYNATNSTALNVVINNVDDFVLTECTQLDEVEFYVYQTNQTVVSTTGATVRIHSTPTPTSITDSVIGTSTTLESPITLSGIFRMTESGANFACIRPLQRIVVDLSSIPQLQAGSYAISWTINGNDVAAVFQPPVTIVGMHGKPGANARQTANNSPDFTIAIVDTGIPGCTVAPPPVPNPQDFPFIIRGNDCGGGGCPPDVNGSGTVDVDDLIAVILDWGCTGGTCVGDADDNGVVDVDDLIAVILGWGACP